MLGAERLGLGQREQWRPGIAGAKNRLVAGEHVEPRRRVGEGGRDRVVVALLASPLDAIAGKAVQAARLRCGEAVEKARHDVIQVLGRLRRSWSSSLSRAARS